MKDNLNKMFREVAKYIEAHGGKAIVMGPISVEKHNKYLHTLRIDFSGMPPKKIK